MQGGKQSPRKTFLTGIGWNFNRSCVWFKNEAVCPIMNAGLYKFSLTTTKKGWFRTSNQCPLKGDVGATAGEWCFQSPQCLQAVPRSGFLGSFQSVKQENQRNQDLIPLVMGKVWELKAKDKHLLWALHYIGVSWIPVMCSSFKMDGDRTKPDDTTMPLQILRGLWFCGRIERRMIVRLVSTVRIVGSNYHILISNPKKPGSMKLYKSFFSKKFNGPGLRHALRLEQASGPMALCGCTNGPYLPGDWNNVEIFWHTLRLRYKLADAGERAETDG